MTAGSTSQEVEGNMETREKGCECHLSSSSHHNHAERPTVFSLLYK